jgi:soluble lytic murein transglycosylase-like protein
MKKTAIILAIGSASIVATGIAVSQESAAEFFMRDRSNNWTGSLYANHPQRPAKALARIPQNRQANVSIVRAAARRHGVPETLALSLTRQESGFNARARSPVGAMGLMQIMPGTWRGQGCRGNPWNPTDNAECGMRYLAKAYRAGGARWAALRYHGGPNVRMHGRKTQHYARVVLAGAGIRETQRPQYIRVAWAGRL